MKNPGLDMFSYVHPKFEPIVDPHDPDYDPEGISDYVPPAEFGRWRTPGQSLHVPLERGPSFGPGESPEDVIHGEVVSPTEQASADKIINGEHESDLPSGNPYVEKAREDLHSPGSDVAVSTLTRLLTGAHPQSMSREAMDAAHNWLSQRFTGVRVNPHHGTLEAASPTGTQLVKRHTYLPAVPEKAGEPPTYSLVNKHGTFESPDPERLVRTMIAFQIVHNEIAQRKKEKDEDDQDGLSTSSGFRGKMQDFLFDLTHPSGDEYSEHRSGTPGQWGQHRVKPVAPGLNPPPSAVFEPDHGIDTDEHGRQGGYVMDADLAPLNWHRQGDTAYSPGHHMRLMLDRHEAKIPRVDPRFPGHTFTYAPNAGTGHTEPRQQSGGINYFVQDRIHPAARENGFDLLSVPKAPKPPGVKSPASGKVPKKGPATSPHDSPLSLPSGSYPTIPPSPGFKTSAAQSNDLCPVCASGYLEPYDYEFHECLNCGSLVKHIGLEKHADDMARRPPRGGLGRGLGEIMDYQGDPLGLADAENADTDDGQDDVLPESYVHPLADEELDSDYVGYEAPRRILGAAPEVDPLDEQMGKLGLQPRHRPGQSRLYTMPMPGTPGGYLRLTEGAQNVAGKPSGWALTADHIIPRSDAWTSHGTRDPEREILLDRMTNKPGETKPFKHPLPDVGDRQMAQKTFLAGGHHPVDDPVLYHAIRDMTENGRNANTYWNAFNRNAYEPPRPLAKNPQATQRDLRGLSSVGNPGLVRFASAR